MHLRTYGRIPSKRSRWWQLASRRSKEVSTVFAYAFLSLLIAGSENRPLLRFSKTCAVSARVANSETIAQNHLISLRFLDLRALSSAYMDVPKPSKNVEDIQ